MGCCFSEPLSENTDTRSISDTPDFRRRPRSTSFYIKDDSEFIKNYEEQVIQASNEAQIEDSEIY